MKKIVVSNYLFVGLVGVFGFFIGSVNTEAASFDSMKDHVEKNDGLIYNPISQGVMGKERSLEYIQYIEKEQDVTGSEEISEEVEFKAFNETKSTDISEGTLASLPIIQPRGAALPTQTIYLDNGSYGSSGFSGGGWRYSGYKFSFRNIRANPYFGVRASLDSFYFNDGMRNNVVPVSNSYVYYASNFNGRALAGYFATYNPINGSRYYIY